MSLNHNPPSSLQDQFDKLSLQTIDSLPDELLLPIFANLSAFERALLLQICKKWNQVILLHTPFWQYLHLSDNFSPSSIVTILSIFNDRSGCRLKHVVIKTKIMNVKHLNRIFGQLKRSGSSLHVLALCQQGEKLNGKTRLFAMQHFPKLDSLITISGPDVLLAAVDYTFKRRVRFDIQDQSTGENGLKFYFTDFLFQLTVKDLEWLSKLDYLRVDATDDIMSMRWILMTTGNLMELNLPSWTTMEEPSSSEIRDLYLNTKRVYLRSLKELVCPRDIGLNVAMSQMLEIDAGQTILSGTADSLALWKVTGLKAAFIHLSPYSRREQMDILVEKRRKFFQINPTIQSLTLRCYQGEYGGDYHHINAVLDVLDTSFQPQESGTTAGGGGGSSSNPVDNLLLPRLVELTIENPIMPDGKLLQKIVKSRTEKNSQFQLELKEGGEVVVIEDWEARGWMN